MKKLIIIFLIAFFAAWIGDIIVADAWIFPEMQYKRAIIQIDNNAPVFLVNSSYLIGFCGSDALEIWADNETAFIYYNNETPCTIKGANQAETKETKIQIVNLTTWANNESLNPFSEYTKLVYHLNNSAATQETPNPFTFDFSIYDYSGYGAGEVKHEDANCIVGKYCFHLDGYNEDGHVIIDNNVFDIFPDEGTIMFWFKTEIEWPPGGRRGALIVADDETSENELIWFMLQSGGNLRFVANSDNTNGPFNILDSITATWEAGRWYSVIGTWENGGNMSLFINGIKEAVNESITIGNFDNSNLYMIIGSGNIAGAAYAHDFSIDELRILNKSISDSEAYAFYYSMNSSLNYSILGDEQNKPGPAPIINITSPQNQTYNETNISLNVFANMEISTWLYELNGAANITFIPNTTINATEGNNIIFVWANNSENTFNFASVSFSVELPEIPEPEINITLGFEKSFCFNKNYLYVKEKDIMENGTAVFNEYLKYCDYGCTNSSIINLGRPGCRASDMEQLIILIIIIVILILAFKKVAK